MDTVEKLQSDDSYCYSLRTTENTYFGNQQTSIPGINSIKKIIKHFGIDEIEKLTVILKNKASLESYRERISRLIRKT